MKSKKLKSLKKGKKSKKLFPEKLNLEKEVKANIEVVKRKNGQEEFMEELDAEGIISAGELNQILKSQMKLNKLENLPVGASLEGGLIFVPRMRNRKEAEGRIYVGEKYDPKYSEANYANKTPGMYAEKGTPASSEKESPKGSDNTGNGNSNP